MTKIKAFKKNLARVFDDNLHTKIWHNVVDWVIIGLILLSTIAIFLSTFDSINEKYGSILKIIDVVTTILFTIEVSLRIWVADEIDPKFKGLWGRVKYCFTFYGFIDFVSTYSFYLAFIFPLPVLALKTLRVARIFRVFRYMKSFRLLSRAFSSKKRELNVSIQFLVVITVILSFLLYFVEHNAQPDVYDNGWHSITWAFAQYIGDPGGFADYSPITLVGKIIACLVGIMGIAIFAVPAGLIGSGFLEAVEEEQKEEKISQDIDRLKIAFERKLDRYTRYQICPMYESVTDIQARLQMDESEILSAVRESKNYRMINLAATIPVDKNPADRLAVEHFYANTVYGACINRGSKVTIVSPSSYVDPVIGNFAFYLAAFGGFNFVSREYGCYPIESYYIIKNNETEGLKEFMNDVDSLASSDDSWVFTILAASGRQEPERPTQLHIGFGGHKGDSSLDAPDLFIHDKATTEQICAGFEKELNEQFGLLSDRQQYHDSFNPAIYLRHLENKDKINGLVLRLAWSFTCWDSRRMQIAQSMADIIKRNIEPERETHNEYLKIKDLGFNGYES